MKKYFLLLSVLVLHACHQDSATYSERWIDAEAYYDEEQTDADSETSALVRKIIRSVDMRFEVEDLQTSIRQISDEATTFGGFVSSMHENNGQRSMRASCTIRIPSEKLDSFVSTVRERAKHIDHIHLESQDVTEEYVDRSIRLTTKEEVRDRYIEILRKRAKSVKDILAAEAQIQSIQEEIEAIQGRLKFLDDRVQMATVRIDIYQRMAYVRRSHESRKPFAARLTDGLLTGWKIVQHVVIGLVTAWPMFLFAGLFIAAHKLWRRRRQKTS